MWGTRMSSWNRSLSSSEAEPHTGGVTSSRSCSWLVVEPRLIVQGRNRPQGMIKWRFLPLHLLSREMVHHAPVTFLLFVRSPSSQLPDSRLLLGPQLTSCPHWRGTADQPFLLADLHMWLLSACSVRALFILFTFLCEYSFSASPWLGLDCEGSLRSVQSVCFLLPLIMMQLCGCLVQGTVTVALTGLFFVSWQPLPRNDFPAIEGNEGLCCCRWGSGWFSFLPSRLFS